MKNRHCAALAVFCYALRCFVANSGKACQVLR
ncbi:hypothetical protein GIW32_23400 [Pseudomonas syringae]|nr:hypothetical protein [Pseudomonas syringae]MCF5245405.1 hypothetical protein [Pseudomonas syringae]